MYASTFTFAKGDWDDEFHRLDQEIAAAARATPGYLGEESWENPQTGLVSNVYYWESLDALELLMRHPRHLEAKARQASWLKGYQVVIAQVLQRYGDDRLAAVLPVAAPPPAPPPSLHGACHCGAVRLTLPAAPDTATECNCSICRRVGGLWVYHALGTVEIKGHPEHTEGYVWGDRTLRTLRCRHCGIVTHWEPLDPAPGARHGVNLRNFDPALRASVRVRHFDGADTWTFLD